MSEAEILETLRACNAQIAALYGQLISISFAMVLAIYYFLNRSKLSMKLLAFGMYLVGVFIFLGLMLEESNVKRVALAALTDLDQTIGASHVTRGVLALQQSWLFKSTGVLENFGIWVLVAATAYLLFVWRKPHHPPAG